MCVVLFHVVLKERHVETNIGLHESTGSVVVGGRKRKVREVGGKKEEKIRKNEASFL